MKNNDQHHIEQARQSSVQKARPTDILVIPEIVQKNQARLSAQPRRKRRINYAKKILNDPFIFNV